MQYFLNTTQKVIPHIKKYSEEEKTAQLFTFILGLLSQEYFDEIHFLFSFIFKLYMFLYYYWLSKNLPALIIESIENAL